MAGEKARVTQEIIDRIQKQAHEDTVVYLESYQSDLNATLSAYDTNQASVLHHKLNKKEESASQEMHRYTAEQNWKVRTSLREIRAEQLKALRDKAIADLQRRVATDDGYEAYLNLAKDKAPKDGVYLVREEDAKYFNDVETKVTAVPLGGFKVVTGTKIYDFTLESAFEEVFEAFSNSLIVDGQE